MNMCLSVSQKAASTVPVTQASRFALSFCFAIPRRLSLSTQSRCVTTQSTPSLAGKQRVRMEGIPCAQEPHMSLSPSPSQPGEQGPQLTREETMHPALRSVNIKHWMMGTENNPTVSAIDEMKKLKNSQKIMRYLKRKKRLGHFQVNQCKECSDRKLDVSSK